MIKKIRIVRIERQRKVCAIENVEHLGSELYVEVLRNLSDGIVLQEREIKVNEARSGYGVSSGIPAKVETRVRRQPT